MSRAHSNSVSQLNKILPVPIELHDGDQDIEQSTNNAEARKANKLSHITNVLVGEHHLVEGESGKSYIVWSIKIILDDSEYSSIVIYKRYNEILKFYQDLVAYYKNSSSTIIPALPPKDNFSIDRLFMSTNWLEERRKGLQWFMSNVLLNPKLQDSDVVKQFILS
ncbi:Phox homologous domain-containing protein [Scheffersomyces xylosifermentans]|uniref:Phox homologous domain-containing protein n=1 Tax=Scheffersomyces xylosifermentans TaxID=1304137 RepID=UPI00315DE022